MSEPALLAHLGVQESGKTFALQRCVRREVLSGLRRFIVCDPNAEWPGACRVERVGVARDIEGARIALDNAERVVLVQGADGELGDVADSMAALAFERGCILVVSEAQLIIPEGTRLAGPWLRLVTGWRHRGAGLWIDSTRPALVAKTALGLCRRWRIFPLGYDDRRWARQLGGDALLEALATASSKLVDGEPGWCVEVDPRTAAAAKSFRARRFGALE